MWGYKNFKNRYYGKDIIDGLLDRNLFADYVNEGNAKRGYDQYFLREYVYNDLKNNSVIHDSYLCEMYKDSTPFLSQRQGSCFIGSPENCDINGKFFECPKKCRLKPDWTFC
jgi:hypothetical protein